MRPNQQNRRMRGRGNRKGPNTLTRSYESNGPDVKIRGSVQQIAEKYATLARDTQASGDHVIAENYLQHAEHYNRIIAAAQAQQQALRESREEQEESSNQGRNNSETAGPQAAASAGEDGSGPQPVINGTPAEVALEEQAITDGDGAAADKPAAKAPQRTNRPRRDESKPADADTAESAPAETSEKPDETASDDESALAAAGS